MEKYCWRIRDRLVLVCSGILVVVGFWAARSLSQEYVLTPNSVRFLMCLVAPQAIQPDSQPTTTGPDSNTAGELLVEGLFQAPASATGQTYESLRQQRAARAQLQKQIGTVETIAIAWRWGTECMLAMILACTLMAAITAKCRFFGLTVAGVILLGTMGTLTAMHLLVRPDFGGMPPLPMRIYGLVAAVQSAYAWALLLAYARPASKA